MTAHAAFLNHLAQDGVRHRFRRGEAMFSQGDFADRVFLIEQGWVKITHASPDGRETVLGLRGPGEVVGELSTVDRAPRSAAAVTLGEVEVLVVPGRVLERALQSDASAALELLRIVAARLRDADVKRVEFSSLSTVGRVASRLVELARALREADRGGRRGRAAAVPGGARGVVRVLARGDGQGAACAAGHRRGDHRPAHGDDPRPGCAAQPRDAAWVIRPRRRAPQDAVAASRRP